MNDIIQVLISDIILDPRLQMRENMDRLVIDEYAESLLDLPPSKIVKGPSGEMWLTGGWHRYHAHKAKKQETMPCTVREGTFLDALAEAAGENYGHGVRRTGEDKRRAVAALLTEEVWQERSDRMIAEACHVSNHLVATVRKTMQTGNVPSLGSSPTKPPRTRAGKDGSPRPAAKPKPKPKIYCTPCQHKIDIGRDLPASCQECHTLRNPPEANGEPPKPPKSGSETFRGDKHWDNMYGPLIRFVDSRAKAKGKGPKQASVYLDAAGNSHERAMDLLSELLKTYSSWKEATA